MSQRTGLRGRYLLPALALFVLLLACGYAWWPIDQLPATARADKVLVTKREHQLILLDHGNILKSYRVALSRDSVGPKVSEGDNKTPEGQYTLDWRNSNSRFHLAIHVSYPNSQDVANAKRQAVRPGGGIMIHGLNRHVRWVGRLHRFWDWTEGCIAVTDAEMEEIWRVVPDGTPIEIREASESALPLR